jgi:hypothetical protein
MPSAVRVFAAVFVGAVAASGCHNSSPTNPAPPPPPAATHATLVVASTSIVGERVGDGGYVYRTVVHVRETVGVTANITAVNLTFLNGTTALMTSRFDQVAPSTGNTCPANASVDTRELAATDTVAAHAFATTVRVEVTYGDASSTGMTVSATADVPPLGPAPPATYTLTGAIFDVAHTGISGARVEVLNGDNAGKAATTDATSTYTLTGLLGGTFRLRASAAGFTTAEQNVTVPDIPRADFILLRPTPACAYAVSATGRINVSFTAGQIGLTIDRSSGDCSWQATTDVDWLTPRSATGSGTTTATFNYAANTTFVGRLGTITVTWNGGSAQLQVSQLPQPADFCVVTLTVGGQNPLNNVPASGGTYTADLVPVPGMPPGICGAWTAVAVAPVSLIGPGAGPAPGSFQFSVAPNASMTPRSGFIQVTFLSGGAGASLTVNQLAGP